MAKIKIKMKEDFLLSQKDIERGIWQFVLDHSIPYKKDLYKCIIATTGKDDLIRRIYSRATNSYKIKDEEYARKELKEESAYYDAIRRKDKKTNDTLAHLGDLEKRGIIGYIKAKTIKYLAYLHKKLLEKWVK